MNYDKIDPIEEEIRKFMKRCDRIILHHKNQEEFHSLREIENKEKRRVTVEKDLNSLDTCFR
jgi:hypothetical protein